MRVRSVRADQDAGPKSSVRGLALLVASLLATASITPARAAQVTFPKDDPKVTMEVPDGWDVTYNAFGLQIVSPEKDLVILADLLPRKKVQADSWAIQAEGKLGAFGVSFKPEHAAKPRAAVTSDAGTPAPPPAAQSVAAAQPTPSADKPAPQTGAPGASAGAPSTPSPGVSGASPSSPSLPPSSPTAVVAAVPAAPVTSGPIDPAARKPPPEAPVGGASSTLSPGVSGASPPSPGAPPSSASSPTDVVATGPAAPVASGPIDRAAPTFTFMNPPMKIDDSPAPPAPPAAAYFGAPSLDTPAKPAAPTAVRTDVAQGFVMDKMDRVSSDRPKIPFAAGRLPSATMNGQPVDVQIVNFSISKSQLFLMIQASGPTDNRAVAILQSVKRPG